MSAPGVAIVLVAFACLGFLAAITGGLVRSAMRLGRAAMDFAEKASPIVDELAAGAEKAADHAAELADKSSFRRT